MANSSYYDDLNSGIEQLAKLFLPGEFDPLGSYPEPERVSALTRAFVVFSHAEIETFLEAWAKAIAKASEDVWTRSKMVSPPLFFLLGAQADRITVPKAIAGRGLDDGPAQMEKLVPKVFNGYYKSIKDNHGVKEANCMSLFTPLGVPVAFFGATLLPSLDSFGSRRGDQAHRAAKAIETPLDPESEYQQVRQLLADLVELDAKLLEYIGALS